MSGMGNERDGGMSGMGDALLYECTPCAINECAIGHGVASYRSAGGTIQVRVHPVRD